MACVDDIKGVIYLRFLDAVPKFVAYFRGRLANTKVKSFSPSLCWEGMYCILGAQKVESLVGVYKAP